MQKLIPFLLVINAVSFLFMLADKFRAIKKMNRIPESVLMFFAMAGGSAGTLLCMHLFRHKIRKRKFAMGIPMILLIQAMLFAVIAYRNPVWP